MSIEQTGGGPSPYSIALLLPDLWAEHERGIDAGRARRAITAAEILAISLVPRTPEDAAVQAMLAVSCLDMVHRLCGAEDEFAVDTLRRTIATLETAVPILLEAAGVDPDKVGTRRYISPIGTGPDGEPPPPWSGPRRRGARVQQSPPRRVIQRRGRLVT